MKTLVNPSTIPAELRRVPNWVCWRYEERDGKLTKVPKNPRTGTNASVNDSSTWTDFDTALQASARFDGIGFVLTPEAGITAFDFDHCLHEDGIGDPDVLELVHLLDSYTEVTPSGEGLRVLCYGRLPDGRKRKGTVEMYDAQRFVTVTGNHLAGTPFTLEHRQQEIEQAYRRVFGVGETPPPARPPAPADLTDAELIERAMNAENGAKFQALWQGDDSGYPSPSEADCALASMLLFWTGGDVARAERLFSLSPRGQREKWRERADYRQRTLEAALSGKTDFYHSNGRKQYSDPERLAPALPAGGVEEWLEQNGITFAQLQQMEFAPVEWCVEGIIPAIGLTLFAAKKSFGKSWALLELAINLSLGLPVWGLEVTRARKVAYIALEDTPRRLQNRQRLASLPCSQNARLFTHWLPPEQGGREALLALIRQGYEVIIIDTLSAWRGLGRPSNGRNVWQEEHNLVRELQQLALEHDVAIVIAHHRRKGSAEDWVDSVAGTGGLTAPADTVIVGERARGEVDATFSVLGRDVVEQELAMQFVGNRWMYVGDAKEVAVSNERRRILDALRELGEATPKEIAEFTGASHASVKMLLLKMRRDGMVTGRGGKYALQTNITVYPVYPVTQPPTDTVNTVNTVNRVNRVNTVNANTQESSTNTIHTPVDCEDNTSVSTPSTVSTLWSYEEEVLDTPAEPVTGFNSKANTVEAPINSNENTVEAPTAEGLPGNSKAFTAEPVDDSGIPDYRTAIIPLRDGVAAWCDTCGCSMLHVLTREGDWECVDCGRRRRFPHSGG